MNHTAKMVRNKLLERVWSLSSTKWNASLGGPRMLHITSNSDPKKPPTSKLGDLDKFKPSTNPEDTINVMEETFGEGYSTRSDEEGFGGIYTDSNESTAEANIIHDPAHHDCTQGSEVKEKEKGRHQTENE